MNARLQTIALREIVVRPQVRRQFDEESIRALANSIRVSGLQHPILCGTCEGGASLIDGERRVRALTLLKTETCPALVLDSDVDGVDRLIRQLVCNLQREDLDPIDRAEGIRELMERASVNADRAAKMLGLAPATVTRALGNLKLPEALREQVAIGEISADAGYQLSRIQDPKEQAALAAEVASKQLTRDALARKLRRRSGSRGAAKSSITRITADLGESRSVTVACEEATLDSVIECLEQVLGRAKRARSQGLSVQTFVRALRDQAATRGADDVPQVA